MPAPASGTTGTETAPPDESTPAATAPAEPAPASVTGATEPTAAAERASAITPPVDTAPTEAEPATAAASAETTTASAPAEAVPEIVVGDATVSAPTPPVDAEAAKQTEVTVTDDAAEAEPTEAVAAATPTAEEAQVEAAGDNSAHTEPWAKLIANPRHAPELLALAAVQTIGPRARDWAARIRAAYPTASDRAIARLATQQFSRVGSLTSIFGAVAGSYAPAALFGTAAVTHAELTLHLAAAYGKDPTDPQRAAEMLVIVGVHPALDEAEAALEDGGSTRGVRRLGRMIVGQTSAWTAVRLVNRYFPGTSLLGAFLTGNAATQSVAARANAFYRRSATPTSATNAATGYNRQTP